MSEQEERSEEPEPSAGTPSENGGPPRSTGASLLDTEVEAPINAAVQDPDYDDRDETEGG